MIGLADVKDHLAIAQRDTGDDIMIDLIIKAVVDHLRSIGVDMSADPLPPALHHAVLLMVGHFYLNREAVTDAPVHVLPLGVARLIAPYRSLNL